MAQDGGGGANKNPYSDSQITHFCLPSLPPSCNQDWGLQVGGAYTGQDPPLLWTQKGISEFKLNVKVNSEVSSDFLEEHPKILVGDFNQFLFATLLGMSPVG